MDDEQIAWVTHVEETEGEEGQGTEKESRASGSDDDGSGKTTQLEGPPQKRKRSGRKTSAMWDHFTVVKGSELDDYLNDRRERLSEEHFDILGWWKANETKYKVVSQIAKDVLAVQVSTVASESAFSTGGRILDSFRSSLSPKMVEALVCSKNWLMSDEEEPIALREYMDEVQALEESEEVAPGDGSCITEVEPV